MTTEEFIKKVAALVEGLQVPASINGSLHLGTAYEPWSELHGLAGIGWHNAEEYEQAFRRALSEIRVTEQSFDL